MESLSICRSCLRGSNALTTSSTRRQSRNPLLSASQSLDRRRAVPIAPTPSRTLKSTAASLQQAAAVQEDPFAPIDRQPATPAQRLRQPFQRPDGTTPPRNNNNNSAYRDTPPNPNFPPTSPRRSNKGAANLLDSLSLLNSNRTHPTPTLSAEILKAAGSSNRVQSQIPKLPPLRLKPSLGRRTDVQGYGAGSALQRALASTEINCKNNRVKQDAASQQVHVRAGQRRKNLRMSRWRGAFMEGFRHEVGRIQRMRRQGW
ncbi:MAG: hypothetical protein Q9227_007208 [Pyrenula ochraceoflavens]